MKKIILKINIPAIGQTNAYSIPREMKICDAKALIVKMIFDEYKGIMKTEKDLKLISKKHMCVLPDEARFADLDIGDNDEIILL